MEVPRDLETNNAVNIRTTAEYLVKKMESETCIKGDKKSIDCALGYVLCGSNYGSCYEGMVPSVIKLAQDISANPGNYIISSSSSSSDDGLGGEK